MNISPFKYWWTSTEEFPSALPNETKSESDGSIIGLNIREQRLKTKLPQFDFSCSDSMTTAEKSLIRDRDYLIEQFVKAKNKGGVAFTKWKKENKYFYIPSILLPEDPSVKLAKGNKKGYVSYCMYLAPAKESGFANVCSDSSEQCETGCLNTAGKGGFDVNVIYARYNKTLLFKYHKKWFFDKLYLEIQDIQRKHNSPTNREYKVPYCIRLNGTSDIPWENIKVFKNRKNIFDSFPNIQFYDYTKVLKRTTYKQPNNYDLTLSRSEGDANQRVCAEAIRKGWRIAVVFNRGKEIYTMKNINGKRTKVSQGYEYDFPKTWHGYPVIDGDETDLRFLDEGGVVVGLSIKGNTQKKSDKENKKLFFVSPDKDGSFKSAERATIFGIGKKYPIQKEIIVGSVGAAETLKDLTPEVKVSVLRKSKTLDKPITSAIDVANKFRQYIDKNKVETQEFFAVMYLKYNNEVIGIYNHAAGGTNSTIADVKLILAGALNLMASAIILCHNHPSSNLQPSQADISLTKKVKEAAQTHDIIVLDHIILTRFGFTSFAEKGIM